MQLRTEWHDLLGRHCPRFAWDSVAVLPLPEPTEWHVEDEYKLMLSFDCAPMLPPGFVLATHMQHRINLDSCA